MHLVQLFFPLADAEGCRFPRGKFEAIEETLAKKFEGFTAYSRAPASGLWVSPDNEISRDDIVVYEVTVEALDRDWWYNYRRHLEQLFEQEALHFRAIPCDLL